MNICPVCAYDKLEFPPRNYSICACCGTEFGYDDRVFSHAQLTKKWVDRKCPWFDEGEPKPLGWNAYMQLIDGNLSWAVPRFVEGLQLQANLTIGPTGVKPAGLLAPGNNWILQPAA
jgi:hypothetical protein